MKKTRRKVSAVHHDYISEIKRIKSLDAITQSAMTGSKHMRITRSQAEIITEANFLYLFRAYESFIGDVFILYTMSKPTKSGKLIESYIKPRGFDHAIQILTSSMSRLEWQDAAVVRDRSKIYLGTNNPILLTYESETSFLNECRYIRNHIAHNSIESEERYIKHIRSYYGGVIPQPIPTPGNFLLSIDRKRSMHRFITYLTRFKSIADAICD